MGWHNVLDIGPRSFVCGHCSNLVGSRQGFVSDEAGSVYVQARRKVYLCPNCEEPTYFVGSRQIPGVPFGNAVRNAPTDVYSVYQQARNCIAANAYTGSVLLSRKLLMNVAVQKGASPGQSFVSYVEYLSERGYVPPDGKEWVDHIRQKGNEATHEIVDMNADDAQELVAFSEMLLKFVYEFPSRVPKKP